MNEFSTVTFDRILEGAFREGSQSSHHHIRPHIAPISHNLSTGAKGLT